AIDGIPFLVVARCRSQDVPALFLRGRSNGNCPSLPPPHLPGERPPAALRHGPGSGDNVGNVKRSEPIYTTAIAAGRTLFGAWRLKPMTTGAEHIPDTGGAVIAMTHFGYLDFALVEWATWRHNRRRIRFMAKKSVFHKPVVGWLMRGMRHISVDMEAGAAAYANAVDALRRGELIGVFPEAGVSASFTVRDLKTGAARLAAEAGVPLVPIAVWGGHRLLTKNRRIRMRERFGVPVSFV